MAKDTKHRLLADDKRTRSVVRKAAARELLPELGKQWAEAKAEELKARAARVKVQNIIIEKLGLTLDDRVYGVVPGSVELTGLEVYREPQKIGLFFLQLCARLGLDYDKIAPEGKRRVDLSKWEQLSDSHRTALAAGLDFAGTGFRIRVPQDLYETAKTIDRLADDEI